MTTIRKKLKSGSVDDIYDVFTFLMKLGTIDDIPSETYTKITGEDFCSIVCPYRKDCHDWRDAPCNKTLTNIELCKMALEKILNLELDFNR